MIEPGEEVRSLSPLSQVIRQLSQNEMIKRAPMTVIRCMELWLKKRTRKTLTLVLPINGRSKMQEHSATLTIRNLLPSFGKASHQTSNPRKDRHRPPFDLGMMVKRVGMRTSILQKCVRDLPV